MDLKMIIMREYVEKLNSKNRNKPQRNNQIEILELKNHNLDVEIYGGLVAKPCRTLQQYGWSTAHRAPLSRGFSRQEYWSVLPFPSPGDLPNPGIESESPAWQEDSLPLSP